MRSCRREQADAAAAAAAAADGAAAALVVRDDPAAWGITRLRAALGDAKHQQYGMLPPNPESGATYTAYLKLRATERSAARARSRSRRANEQTAAAAAAATAAVAAASEAAGTPLSPADDLRARAVAAGLTVDDDDRGDGAAPSPSGTAAAAGSAHRRRRRRKGSKSRSPSPRGKAKAGSANEIGRTVVPDALRALSSPVDRDDGDDDDRARARRLLMTPPTTRLGGGNSGDALGSPHPFALDGGAPGAGAADDDEDDAVAVPNVATTATGQPVNRVLLGVAASLHAAGLGGGDLLSAYAPRSATAPLTVAQMRRAVARERARHERRRVALKIETLIASVPEREYCSPRDRVDLTDDDLQFDFHKDLDARRAAAAARERARQVKAEREEVERRERERKQRFYLGKAKAHAQQLIAASPGGSKSPTAAGTAATMRDDEETKRTDASNGDGNDAEEDDDNAGALRSYRRQGDRDLMHGLRATRERLILRHHPLVLAAIDRFWTTCVRYPIAPEDLPPQPTAAADPAAPTDEDGAGGGAERAPALCIRWKEYLELHTRMARVLHGHFAPLKARQSALDDWRRDSAPCGGHHLDHTRFQDALFEVADHWTASTDAAEYVAFLAKLYLRITGPRLTAAERASRLQRKRERGLSRFRECSWRVLRQVQARRRGEPNELDDDTGDSPEGAIELRDDDGGGGADGNADLYQIKRTPFIANLVSAFTRTAKQSAWDKYADPNYKFDAHNNPSAVASTSHHRRGSSLLRRRSVDDGSSHDAAPGALTPHHLGVAMAGGGGRRSSLPHPSFFAHHRRTSSGADTGSPRAGLRNSPGPRSDPPPKTVSFALPSDESPTAAAPVALPSPPMPVINEEDRAAYEQHLRDLQHSTTAATTAAHAAAVAARRSGAALRVGHGRAPSSLSTSRGGLVLETPPETERHVMRRKAAEKRERDEQRRVVRADPVGALQRWMDERDALDVHHDRLVVSTRYPAGRRRGHAGGGGSGLLGCPVDTDPVASQTLWLERLLTNPAPVAAIDVPWTRLLLRYLYAADVVVRTEHDALDAQLDTLVATAVAAAPVASAAAASSLVAPTVPPGAMGSTPSTSSSSSASAASTPAPTLPPSPNAAKGDVAVSAASSAPPSPASGTTEPPSAALLRDRRFWALLQAYTDAARSGHAHVRRLVLTSAAIQLFQRTARKLLNNHPHELAPLLARGGAGSTKRAVDSAVSSARARATGGPSPQHPNAAMAAAAGAWRRRRPATTPATGNTSRSHLGTPKSTRASARGGAGGGTVGGEEEMTHKTLHVEITAPPSAAAIATPSTATHGTTSPADEGADATAKQPVPSVKQPHHVSLFALASPQTPIVQSVSYLATARHAALSPDTNATSPVPRPASAPAPRRTSSLSIVVEAASRGDDDGGSGSGAADGNKRAFGAPPGVPFTPHSMPQFIAHTPKGRSAAGTGLTTPGGGSGAGKPPPTPTTAATAHFNGLMGSLRESLDAATGQVALMSARHDRLRARLLSPSHGTATAGEVAPFDSAESKVADDDDEKLLGTGTRNNDLLDDETQRQAAAAAKARAMNEVDRLTNTYSPFSAEARSTVTASSRPDGTAKHIARVKAARADSSPAPTAGAESARPQSATASRPTLLAVAGGGDPSSSSPPRSPRSQAVVHTVATHLEGGFESPLPLPSPAIRPRSARTRGTAESAATHGDRDGDDDDGWTLYGTGFMTARGGTPPNTTLSSRAQPPAVAFGPSPQLERAWAETQRAGTHAGGDGAGPLQRPASAAALVARADTLHLPLQPATATERFVDVALGVPVPVSGVAPRPFGALDATPTPTRPQGHEPWHVARMRAQQHTSVPLRRQSLLAQQHEQQQHPPEPHLRVAQNAAAAAAAQVRSLWAAASAVPVAGGARTRSPSPPHEPGHAPVPRAVQERLTTASTSTAPMAGLRVMRRAASASRLRRTSPQSRLARVERGVGSVDDHVTALWVLPDRSVGPASRPATAAPVVAAATNAAVTTATAAMAPLRCVAPSRPGSASTVRGGAALRPAPAVEHQQPHARSLGSTQGPVRARPTSASVQSQRTAPAAAASGVGAASVGAMWRPTNIVDALTSPKKSQRNAMLM